MTDIIRIPNIARYVQEIINGELILTPKKVYITEDQLYMNCLAKSKIIQCIINTEDRVISNNKYSSVLTDIWSEMPAQKILQNTTFNLKLTDEKGEKGYNWNDRIKMSYQSKDANGTMKEIVKMVKLNNYTMDISIKLNSEKIINFKIE